MKEKTRNKTDFFDKVYQIVRHIPEGRVTTYGLIAAYVGDPRAARMVGRAMNNSHNQNPPVPAHRVVNRNGVLTGKHHFGGENTMKELLESEGLLIKNDQIIEFEKHIWDPKSELNISFF